MFIKYIKIHIHYTYFFILSERCDAVRPIMQQQLLEESKRVQLYQIEERKSLKAMAKDYDNMWHDVGLKRQMEQVRH